MKKGLTLYKLEHTALLTRSTLILTDGEEYFSFTPNIQAFEHKYFSNGKIIAFVHNKNFFMIPYHKKIIDLLVKEMFEEEEIPIPIHGDFLPFNHIAEWQMLQNIVSTEKLFNQ